MPLSEHEQKLLEQLEKQLHEDDPKFASSMGSDAGRSWSTRHLVIGVLATLAGVVLLLFGVTIQNIFVGVLGFVVMGAGVYYATMRGAAAGKAKAAGAGRKSGKPRSSFMSNLEERWDERHRGRTLDRGRFTGPPLRPPLSTTGRPAVTVKDPLRRVFCR